METQQTSPVPKVLWKSLKTIGCSQYEVSTEGDVRNIFSKRTLEGSHKDGYRSVSLKVDTGENKAFLVHRLVAEVFIPRPSTDPTLTVDHIDGNRGNNAVYNLRWATKVQQIKNRRLKPSKRGRVVAQYTLEGIFVARWDKMITAATSLGVSYHMIAASCKGQKIVKDAYIFRFLEDTKDKEEKILQQEIKNLIIKIRKDSSDKAIFSGRKLQDVPTVGTKVAPESEDSSSSDESGYETPTEGDKIPTSPPVLSGSSIRPEVVPTGTTGSTIPPVLPVPTSPPVLPVPPSTSLLQTALSFASRMFIAAPAPKEGLVTISMSSLLYNKLLQQQVIKEEWVHAIGKVEQEHLEWEVDNYIKEALSLSGQEKINDQALYCAYLLWRDPKRVFPIPRELFLRIFTSRISVYPTCRKTPEGYLGVTLNGKWRASKGI